MNQHNNTPNSRVVCHIIYIPNLSFFKSQFEYIYIFFLFKVLLTSLHPEIPSNPLIVPTTGLSKAKVQRNWLQHLKMPSNHSNIIGLPSCHYGLLRNRAFYTSQWPKKNTFEWPKVVSEVIFPRFWGVVCIEKCFRIFVSVIGSAVSEMSQFA